MIQKTQYKKSKYLYFYKSADGSYVVLNCLRNRLYVVGEALYQRLLLGEQSMLDEETEVSKRERILVPREIDETELMKEYIHDFDKKNVMNIVIVPTMQCNFECGYCLQNHSSGKITKEFADDILSYINRYIDYYSVLSIEWFGGEPLMAQDEILYIISGAKKLCIDKGKVFISTMTTNGYFLNYQTFMKLKNRYVLYYQITIDGMEEHHNKMRPCKNGGPTFEIIIDNLKDILTRCKSSIFRICIRLNIDKYLYENIDKVIESFKELFNDDPRIQFFLTPIVDMGGEKIEKIKDDLLNRRDLLLELNRKFLQAGLNLYFEDREGINSQQCYSYGKHNFTFNYNSQILKCNQGVGNGEQEKADICSIGTLDHSGCISFHENYNCWLDKKIEGRCSDCCFLLICQSVQCPLRLIKNNRFCIKESNYIDSLIERELIRNNYTTI